MVRRFSLRLALLAFVFASPLSILPLPESAIAAPRSDRLGVQAAAAAFEGRFGEAGDFAQQSGDPAAMKLVEFVYLRDKGKNAGFSRIKDFLDAAPKWPLSETLTKRAEQALYLERNAGQSVFDFFSGRKPFTAEGKLALARANLAAGNRSAARALVVEAYSEHVLDADLERDIPSEFSEIMSSDDHKRRLWEMIFAQETNAAIRAAKRLSGDYQAAAKAAQLLIRGASGAEKAYAGLSSSMRKQPAVLYALARHYRKLDKDSKARAILLGLPAGGQTEGAAEALWVERRIMARKSLGPENSGNWKAAYQLARAHGLEDGPSFVEAEFLAGWIALRSLKDPGLALKHFTRLEGNAPTRTDRARAKYWLGRTYAALGEKSKARASYEEASAFPTIFYGQLAREQIGLAKKPVPINSGQPSAKARASIENDEVVRAFRMVQGAGRTRELNSFLWSLSSRFKTVDEMNAVAEMTWDAGGPTMALRFAKLAGAKNIDVDSWGYPTKALPNWKHMGRPVEKALVYGLSRQESEFDPKAGSRVGAQGLMQLMPGTAKLVAKQYKVPYAPAKLTGDPAYNVKLGAAHLGDLIDNYDGSYILTLVAYNAGPRRAREWVAAYGDPRGGQVDPIDWVESIPFQETRQYVQKVLQNVHIYRSRMAPGSMMAMSADLGRGGSHAIAVAASDELGTGGTCASKGDDIADLIQSCDTLSE